MSNVSHPQRLQGLALRQATPVSTQVPSGQPVSRAQQLRAVAGDLVALTKPRITLMVLFTAMAGMWVAPVAPTLQAGFAALFSIALVVSAANSLNCYLERDLDRLMPRTCRRPLPAGRVAPSAGLVFTVFLGIVAVLALLALANPMTSFLGIVSLVLYAALYTPMKQLTPLALFVGAVPGAMPPLMGWTAATGSLDAAGLALFGVLFLWQLPHFLAIATFREREYSAAGHRVLPAVWGRKVSYVHSVLWAALLIPVSLVFEPLGLVAGAYSWLAGALGLAYLAVTVMELRPSRGDAGAKRVFFTSLLYLPLWMLTLIATLS